MQVDKLANDRDDNTAAGSAKLSGQRGGTIITIDARRKTASGRLSFLYHFAAAPQPPKADQPRTHRLRC